MYPSMCNHGKGGIVNHYYSEPGSALAEMGKKSDDHQFVTKTDSTRFDPAQDRIPSLEMAAEVGSVESGITA